MNRKRKARVFTALIALLLTAVFLFSACEVINGPNAVVATVDGTEIYRWEVDYYYERNLSNYTSVGGLDPENNSEEKLMIYKSILETLINDTAMNLYAEELGYGLTDEEKAEIDAEYALPGRKTSRPLPKSTTATWKRANRPTLTIWPTTTSPKRSWWRACTPRPCARR